MLSRRAWAAAMTAAALLDRLESVRQTGPDRWIARCPAHQDRNPSLAIRELDDGRVLLHDFAGCDPLSVLHAVGLEVAALFPERLDHHFKPSHRSIPARDLLELIDRQALTVALIASDFLEHRDIDEPTWQMLAGSARRIGEARDMASPARAGR